MNEEYLLEVIRTIEGGNSIKYISPSYASKNDIMQRIYEDMRIALGSLLKQGKIDYHKTLNSWAVEAKE